MDKTELSTVQFKTLRKEWSFPEGYDEPARLSLGVVASQPEPASVSPGCRLYRESDFQPWKELAAVVRSLAFEDSVDGVEQLSGDRY